MAGAKAGTAGRLNLLFNILENRRAGLWAAAVALVASLLFTFILFPLISGPMEVMLDPDDYGRLGLGIYNHGGLSYYGDSPEPTVQRGPVYPILVALSLYLGGGKHPQAIQLTQCLIMALIVLLAHDLTRMLAGARAAGAAAFGCALFPSLIWYTPRLYIETPFTFLFTLVAWAALRLADRPTAWRAVGLGLALGLACLTKSTMLPFCLLLPLGLAALKKGPSLKTAALAGLISILVVVPWTVRNHNLTGRLIPVHVLAGFNLVVGDVFVDNWSNHPLSYAKLYDLAQERIHELRQQVQTGSYGWRNELKLEAAATELSLKRYRADPLFLLKKVAINALTFWYLGQTPLKSVVIGLEQACLLGLFILAGIRLLGQRGIRSRPGLLVGLTLLYYLAHLPIFAFGRLSVVLIPVMIAAAAAGLIPSPESRRAEG